ncbi:MAG: hypothetical protein V1845_01765 [bacterium]
MKTPEKYWFNDAEEIRKHLGNLADFKKLVDARVKNAEQGENNNPFVIFGRFLLDRGKDKPIQFYRPPIVERFPAIRDVVTVAEVEEAFRPRTIFFQNFSTSEYFIPDSVNVCEACGLGWNIKNCHDLKHVETRLDPIELIEWIGRKFGDVKAHFLVPRGSMIRLLRRQGWRQGWMYNLQWNPTKDVKDVDVKPGDDYVVKQGDRLCLEVYSLFHENCFRSHMMKKRTEEVRALFPAAGFGELWPELVVKKTSRHGETDIVWRVYTFFGALEITGDDWGKFKISGHLCGRELSEIVSGRQGRIRYWDIEGNAKELVDQLIKIRETIEKENRK